MKATAVQRTVSPRRCPWACRFPNDAGWRYRVRRLVDGALAAAMVLGIIAVVFFLLSLSV